MIASKDAEGLDAKKIIEIKGQLGVIDKKKGVIEEAIVTKQREVIMEDDQLDKKLQLMYGKPLLYGQTVQLKQVYTNKYLSISDKTVARLAYNHMGVFLTEFGGPSANFKIMPKYKIRGEGDAVRAGDQCVLLSEKASGQYLTCTPEKTFDERNLISDAHVFQQGDHEASAAAAARGWTVKELFRGKEPGNRKRKDYIQAGDVVQLLHRYDLLALVRQLSLHVLKLIACMRPTRPTTAMH